MATESSSPEESQNLDPLRKILWEQKKNLISPVFLYINEENKKESRLLAVKNVFLIFNEEAQKALLSALPNTSENLALIIGGGLFSVSELLQVMKEYPEIGLFLAVDPCCNNLEYFTYCKPDSFPKESLDPNTSQFPTPQSLPRQIGIVLPISLQLLSQKLLPQQTQIKYIEMISPSPGDSPVNLVKFGLSYLKERGEFRIYLSTEDLNSSFPSGSLHHLEDSILNSILSGNFSSEKQQKLKEYYRQILDLKENDSLEVEIITSEEARKQRDSAHFGLFKTSNRRKNYVLIIKIKKGINQV